MARRSSRGDRGGEFALIDSFLEPFGLDRSGANFSATHSRVSGVIVGPGDDCAQLRPSPGMTLIATTDALVEGVHFDPRWSTPEDVGWKALAVNLSDLAAAGATPRWFLCSLGVPRESKKSSTWNVRGIARGAVRPRASRFFNLEKSNINQLANRLGTGMSLLSRICGIALAGGNITAADCWSITITALGEARRPLSRAGAKPGDRLLLVGELGAAALGLRLLQNGATVEPVELSPPARRRAAREEPLSREWSDATRLAMVSQLRPRPWFEAGQLAAGVASAAIDISDGLLQDLEHLCARSHCGAALALEALPRSLAVQVAEAEFTETGWPLSLAGGEDYALLLAVPPRKLAKLVAALAAEEIPCCDIGSITPRNPRTSPIRLLEHGHARPLPARRGHDHLRDG